MPLSHLKPHTARYSCAVLQSTLQAGCRGPRTYGPRVSCCRPHLGGRRKGCVQVAGGGCWNAELLAAGDPGRHEGCAVGPGERSVVGDACGRQEGVAHEQVRLVLQAADTAGGNTGLVRKLGCAVSEAPRVHGAASGDSAPGRAKAYAPARLQRLRRAPPPQALLAKSVCEARGARQALLRRLALLPQRLLLAQHACQACLQRGHPFLNSLHAACPVSRVLGEGYSHRAQTSTLLFAEAAAAMSSIQAKHQTGANLNGAG